MKVDIFLMSKTYIPALMKVVIILLIITRDGYIGLWSNLPETGRVRLRTLRLKELRG